MSTSKAEKAFELLRLFNRKERYHLLVDAVTGKDFSLTNGFRENLNRALAKSGDSTPVPAEPRKKTGQGDGSLEQPRNVYVAMDYHLDWIAAALVLVHEYPHEELDALLEQHKNLSSTENKLPHTKSEVITGNQQDTDLLVAFLSEDRQTLHLLLVEAKVESGWDGEQIKSKGKRLAAIFDDSDEEFNFVDCRFVLAGPGAETKPPGFKKGTLKDLPAMFFNDGQPGEKQKDAKAMYRINLAARHRLYHPTRASGEHEYWGIKNTFNPKK